MKTLWLGLALAVISNQAPRIVRRQALFWLAQSDKNESIAASTALLPFFL